MQKKIVSKILVLACSSLIFNIAHAYVITLQNETDYSLDVTLSYDAELICKTERFHLQKRETKKIQVGACCVNLFQIDNVRGPRRFDNKVLTYKRILHLHGITCTDQTLIIYLAPDIGKELIPDSIQQGIQIGK